MIISDDKYKYETEIPEKTDLNKFHSNSLLFSRLHRFRVVVHVERVCVDGSKRLRRGSLRHPHTASIYGLIIESTAVLQIRSGVASNFMSCCC